MKPYEEVIDGLSLLRLGPGPRHESVCHRLHTLAAAALRGSPLSRLLPARSPITLSHGNVIRPDLAIVTTPNAKLWLVTEVIDPADHEPDTVTKKSLYEDQRIARLWMVDPRYDNVEIYHATPYGLMLKGILAGRDVLQEQLLPGFRTTIAELFAP